jgi:enterochelin esterase-like enzyme
VAQWHSSPCEAQHSRIPALFAYGFRPDITIQINAIVLIPCSYFTDGVAAFHGRELDEVAAKLVATGKIPPTIFVGIDNGGSARESKNPSSDRAYEYLPYPDSSLEPPVPEPHGKLFPQFLETEVRPLVESHYRTNGDVGLAGASYGGPIAIYTVMENPGRYKWLLIESHLSILRITSYSGALKNLSNGRCEFMSELERTRVRAMPSVRWWTTLDALSNQ